jgi:hypothetical protein
MQVMVNVPETLPEDVLQKLIAQFEHRLQQEAKSLKTPHAQLSKWVKIAQEAHDESPLQGLSDYVLACSREIRNNFAFPHDEEER